VLTIRAGIALLIGTAAALAASCGGEDEVSYEVFATVDDASISLSRADSARLAVYVLDQEDRPPPLGSRVIINCLGGDQQPSGRVGSGGQPVGTVLLDQVGQGNTEIRCAEDAEPGDTLLCFAVLEDGTRGIAPQLTCVE
jgi:hypothetical protein